MKKQATIMGMQVTVHIVDQASEHDFAEIFAYLKHIDQKFSTYKKNSEIEKINRGEIKESQYSHEMKHVLKLCDDTREETKGYFDIRINGRIDPSGLVKGYAIYEASQILLQKEFKNFYVEIAGDAQIHGVNDIGQKWSVGIQNPFNTKEIVKVVKLTNKGIATSGTYMRGMHIYNPLTKKEADEIMSATIVGPTVYDADRFATAAFAMGIKGIDFIEQLKDFEAYMITKKGHAIMTSGFEHYVHNKQMHA